jgi:hypothetical protein
MFFAVKMGFHTISLYKDIERRFQAQRYYRMSYNHLSRISPLRRDLASGMPKEKDLRSAKGGFSTSTID